MRPISHSASSHDAQGQEPGPFINHDLHTAAEVGWNDGRWSAGEFVLVGILKSVYFSCLLHIPSHHIQKQY